MSLFHQRVPLGKTEDGKLVFASREALDALNNNNATTATTATAGAASALPALPAGYLLIQINGEVFKTPYYSP